MNFIIAQVIGVIALVFTMLSFHQKNKKNILICQSMASFGYVAQYICLFAWAGAVMTFIGFSRDIIYYFYEVKKKKKPIAILFFTIFTIIICEIFTYSNPASLLPAIVALAYTITLWQNNMKIFRYVAAISALVWIIYDVSISALISTIACLLEFNSAVFAIIRFDSNKKD